MRIKTLVSLLFSLHLTMTMGCTMQQTTSFDTRTWQSQRGAAPQDNKRGTMVTALEQALRNDMTRDEVIALLGEPDATDAATQTDIYELGVSPFGIDEEYYEIAYREGAVSSHGWRRR